jgi:bacillithiol synthase
MQLEKFELEQIGGFSPLFIDFISKKEAIKPFYSHFPDLEGFAESLKVRQFDTQKRQNLVDALTKQYMGVSDSPDFTPLFNERCFTVTTGHQLNIFTGPLYVIYKIVSTINLARQLAQKFPEYTFIPVYWMATEDHDFEEINHFNLFNKTYTWQTNQKGAVGKMNCAEIEAILDEMPEKLALFENAYKNASNLTNAVRDYMHSLFGKNGLICVDGDDILLKAAFKPIIKEELLHRKTIGLVEKSSENLEKLGYKTQVKGREINFFYLDTNLRERIVFEDNLFKVLNTNLSFTEAQLVALIDSNPERFSPNVILRPVYQEVILPNIAYLGGPAEVVYWLQLKASFEQFGIQYPIVMPRNFALYINNATKKRMEKLGMTNASLWLDEQDLKKDYVANNTENQFEISSEMAEIGQKFDAILKKALPIDKTLEGVVLAEKQKALNAIESLEKRIIKAEERTFETAINQLIGVKNKLFPNGSPQERSDNFLNFYLNNPQFIDQLYDHFDPLDFKFNVIIEE